jgi:glutathione synthase/RimK-type ligase-like ATP-grasp enzyme
MPTLIVLNNTKEWSLDIPGVEVVSARQYLTEPTYADYRGAKVFNLCRSYRYQSLGYYVTLLASARGHKPLPSITTMQDMRSHTMIRFVSDDLDEMIQETLSPLRKTEFTLSIYFGRNLEEHYDRLSLQLFNLFQAPLLRARFVKNGKWELRGIKPIPLGDIPEDHENFLVQVASEHFAGRGVSVRKKAAMKYNLAILVNPNEEMCPSNEKAIKKFIKAANSVGLEAELIGRDDFGRLAEFDALFIRETTAVNHYTYRFSRRAAVEGLVVIDDPESIVRCGNKVYLAERMQRNDVLVPRTLLIHKDNIDLIGKELGFPCVLKRPDSSFSKGVVKVSDEKDLQIKITEMLEDSELVVVQEFLPTDYDWRVGELDRQPFFACKYHMVKGHWQIYKNQDKGGFDCGDFETVPVEIAPRDVVRTALKAANLIGDGFYGVDVKKSNKKCYVMEVNDNPSVDAGVEDAVLRDELYRRLMQVFLKRIEQQKYGGYFG